MEYHPPHISTCAPPKQTHLREVASPTVHTLRAGQYLSWLDMCQIGAQYAKTQLTIRLMCNVIYCLVDCDGSARCRLSNTHTIVPL